MEKKPLSDMPQLVSDTKEPNFPVKTSKKLKIYLRDANKEMVEAWNVVFHDPRVINLAEAHGVELEFDIAEGNIMDVSCDAIVSFTNSTGNMTSNENFLQKFGNRLETDIVNQITKKHHGMLPVGRSTILSLSKYKSQFRFLIASPVMTIPDLNCECLGPFMAFKSVLEIVDVYNNSPIASKLKTRIISIACPGISSVDIPVFRSALQIRAAIDSYFNCAFVGRNFKSQREFYVFLTTIKKPFNIQTLYTP